MPDGPFESFAVTARCNLHARVLYGRDDHHQAEALFKAWARALDVAELGVTPFGFQGWHLYPYFIAHEGGGGRYIADFVRYLRPEALRVDVAGPDEPAPSVAGGRQQPGEAVVRSGLFTWRWTERRRFTLIRRAESGPAEWTIEARAYRAEDFPRDEEECRALLRRR